MTAAWHRHTLDPVHSVYPSATPYDTPERTALVQTVRAFAMDEVLPGANELDPRREDIPDHLLDRMGELCLFGVLIGEEEGGLGLGVLDYCLVSEELARALAERGSIIARGDGAGVGGLRHQAVGRARPVRRLPPPARAHPSPGEGRGLSDGLELFLVEKERGALQDANTYSQQRKQFGEPIGNQQVIRHAETSRAKLFASEMAERVTSQALQIFGGNGYTTDYAAERYWRDARLTKIFEGTSQIQRRIIADSLISGAPLDVPADR
ncbi:hypothetical protein BH10ACT10_BH10ACT10_13440 [soil metagenome]